MALPPGPAAPLPWTAAAWLVRPGPLMERCRRSYGDVFTLGLPASGRCVFVAGAAEVRQVLTAPAGTLRAGEGNRPLRPVLGSESLLLLDGRDHLRHRRLMLPPFHGERLNGYEALMRQIAADAIRTWPRGRPDPMQPRMQAITLEIILRVVFGLDDTERLASMRARLLELIAAALTPAGLLALLSPAAVPLLRRFTRARARVDEALHAEIRARRRAPDLDERTDVFSLLVRARDEDGSGLTDGELRDELITLLIAGHETTATGLAWACERIARTPGVAGRLRAEAARGEHEYADAVVSETLRLRAPIPVVARRAAVPFTVGEWTLPKGTVLVPCAYLVHRDERIYPDPYAFRPERFLGSAPETYGWLPFGGGTRRCIGARFAALEMRVVLQELVARLDMAAAGVAPEPVRRRSLVLAPARGGRVVPTTARASAARSERRGSDRAPRCA